MNTGLMIVLILVFVGVAGILCWLVAALSYRFFVLRRTGNPVVLRRTSPTHVGGWRYGVVLYGDTQLRFFRLASLRIRADRHLGRHDIEIDDRREPDAGETEILGPDVRIVAFTLGEDRYEIALDTDGLTGLLAWLESRPPEHMVRTRGREARRRGWTDH